jgi:dCMP deaminase
MTAQIEVPPRPTHDEIFMQTAELFARRSTCVRGQVGCVAVLDNRIVCVGYNGAPAGFPHCTEVGCGGGVKVSVPKDLHPDEEFWDFPNGCTRAVHAEANMVFHAAKKGIALEDCVVYNTHGPCVNCAYALINAGIYRLVFRQPYRLPDGEQLVKQAGIVVDRYGS